MPLLRQANIDLSEQDESVDHVVQGGFLRKRLDDSDDLVSRWSDHHGGRWKGGPSYAERCPPFYAFDFGAFAFPSGFGADGRGRQSRNDGDGATGQRAGVTGGCGLAIRGERGWESDIGGARGWEH